MLTKVLNFICKAVRLLWKLCDNAYFTLLCYDLDVFVYWLCILFMFRDYGMRPYWLNLEYNISLNMLYDSVWEAPVLLQFQLPI